MGKNEAEKRQKQHEDQNYKTKSLQACQQFHEAICKLSIRITMYLDGNGTM